MPSDHRQLGTDSWKVLKTEFTFKNANISKVLPYCEISYTSQKKSAGRIIVLYCSSNSNATYEIVACALWDLVRSRSSTVYSVWRLHLTVAGVVCTGRYLFAEYMRFYSTSFITCAWDHGWTMFVDIHCAESVRTHAFNSTRDTEEFQRPLRHVRLSVRTVNRERTMIIQNDDKNP